VCTFVVCTIRLVFYTVELDYLVDVIGSCGCK
jgi:hypothetical protein